MDTKKPEIIIGPTGSFFISIMIGAISGAGAVAFRGLIALIHNLLFLNSWSVHYNANDHTPASPLGPWMILIPVIASIGVTYLVTTFAPEAKGHGVPEVMEAVYYRKGLIRPVVVWIKSVASALSIGSGGSVGREGPIVQIGSAIGSWLGGVLRVPPWERITWLACGAGGGIAATFNTPVGGILFATELILHEVSAKTLIPVALSCATASYVGRMVFGPSPSFVIPALESPEASLTALRILPAYALLGILMGLASVVFIRTLYKTEDLFSSFVKKSPYLRHGLGMALVGVMMVAFEMASGHYYVQGVGYATIQDVLSGKNLATSFLLLLALSKLVATSVTLGSGASGGIFSPSLFLGATLGGAFGRSVQSVFPRLLVNPVAFAVVGMAAAVGGATGAATTAIVMIFEMTGDYKVIVPMTVAVAISYGIRALLCQDSIYTTKLIRRGKAVPLAFHADVYFVKDTEELMERRFKLVDGTMHVSEFLRQLQSDGTERYYLIEEGGRLRGVLMPRLIFDISTMVERNDWRELPLTQFADSNYALVHKGSTLGSAIKRLRLTRAEFILVSRTTPLRSPNDILGILSKEHVADLLVSGSELFSSDLDGRKNHGPSSDPGNSLRS